MAKDPFKSPPTMVQGSRQASSGTLAHAPTQVSQGQAPVDLGKLMPAPSRATPTMGTVVGGPAPGVAALGRKTPVNPTMAAVSGNRAGWESLPAETQAAVKGHEAVTKYNMDPQVVAGYLSAEQGGISGSLARNGGKVPIGPGRRQSQRVAQAPGAMQV